jgi:regulator of RNase E activity RraB
MAEEWDFYVTAVDDHPASIFVDLGLAATAPEKDRPCLLRVTVKMHVIRDDGLSDDEETETLYAIEDELFANVSRALRARYVGRLTTQGSRVYFYYGTGGDNFAGAVSRAFKSFPNYKFLCTDEQDPDWEIYFGLLHPGALDMQSIQNRRVVERLTTSGDDLTQPRNVDHWLYFPSESSRSQFSTQVESEGFAVEPFAAEKPDAEFGFGLRLSRSDRVDLETIDALAIDLFLRAEHCGGEYDGWGCPVVPGGE